MTHVDRYLHGLLTGETQLCRISSAITCPQELILALMCSWVFIVAHSKHSLHCKDQVVNDITEIITVRESYKINQQTVWAKYGVLTIRNSKHWTWKCSLTHTLLLHPFPFLVSEWYIITHIFHCYLPPTFIFRIFNLPFSSTDTLCC